MEVCEDTLDRELTLTVLLPGGTEETATVHGSKPVMDVLVTLCGEYHLNPSEHIMELVSPNQNHIKFKPNSLIGSLEAEQVVLRHRGEDERTKRKDPYMPEVSVRLMIFYRRVHRAVVRVSPKVPLSELLPAICDKCEYDPETTLLFLNSQSEEPLDLTKSLNDHGIREVFAKDMKVINLPEPVATPDSEASKENKLPPAKDKSEKGKENKSFFSFFRIAKKKTQKGVSASAPTSPLLHKQRTLSLSFLTSRCSTLPSEKSKKRRAPLPPLLASQSFPTNLNTSQPVLTADDPGKETTLSHSSSSESSLKRTKRRAPPPPALPPPPSPPPDDDATEDPAPKDVLGNLAPVTEVPEETLNEERSTNYPVTALVHHTMNGTGGCLCEELHRNDKPREESSVCVECGSRKYECDRPTPCGQPEESAASPSRRTPSAGSSLHNSPSWVGVGSSSGRLLRSSGSIGSGLTTFTVIPKLRDRERQHRAYQLEKQHSLDGPGYHSEQVEPSRRSSGHGEREGNASESADKSKDWRTPATKPKPISGVPFWASQRSTAGHTSLMQELQKRVPVLNGEPHDQNRDRAEEKSRYGEREDQGGRNVEKKEEEKKEESADEEDWEEGKASHEEMMEQERDEVEENEEEEEDKEEEEEDKEEEDVEEEGEEDEGFDGSEKESVEDDVEDDGGEKESVDDDDVVEDDGGDQEEEEEGEEKREEDEDEEEEEKEDSFPPPPPPVFWKEGAKASQYSPTEAHHHPVDLSSTPGSCGSGRLPVAESPGGLSLFALAVAQRAQRFTQAFNTNRRRPGHPESPYSNGFVPTDLR